MRLIIGVLFSSALLLLSSCGKSPQEPLGGQVSESSLNQAHPQEYPVQHNAEVVQAAQGEGQMVNSVVDGQAGAHTPDDLSASGHNGELGANHENAGLTLHGHEQSNASGQDGRRHLRDHGGRGSNHHQHGEAQSTEDQGANSSKQIAVGDKVPDFEVSINGTKWMLSELQENTEITKDGVLVLTFWCSFCHSCRDVEHLLDELAKQYKGEAGVIAVDASAGETADDVVEFAREHGLTFPIALNLTGSAADIFGVSVTTTTMVIDGKGVLRYCGQFGDQEHAFAADALKAVLLDQEVPVKKTRHKG